MASGHAGRQWLEGFKFSVYVITPIAATVYLGTGAYPYLEKMIHQTAYIVYPPEGPKPPTSKVDLEAARKDRRGILAQRREEKEDQILNSSGK